MPGLDVLRAVGLGFVNWRSGGVVGLSALRPGMYVVKLCPVRFGLMLWRGISPRYIPVCSGLACPVVLALLLHGVGAE